MFFDFDFDFPPRLGAVRHEVPPFDPVEQVPPPPIILGPPPLAPGFEYGPCDVVIELVAVPGYGDAGP